MNQPAPWNSQCEVSLAANANVAHLLVVDYFGAAFGLAFSPDVQSRESFVREGPQP